MIATTEREMFAEVKEATGLPDDVVREIVAMELGQSPGDSIENDKDDVTFESRAGIFTNNE